jgi:hypothetical protein
MLSRKTDFNAKVEPEFHNLILVEMKDNHKREGNCQKRQCEMDDRIVGDSPQHHTYGWSLIENHLAIFGYASIATHFSSSSIHLLKP